MNHAPISEYMMALPFTIGEDIVLAEAIKLMQRHKIRHLPVQHAGKLVGILSDRDVHVALSMHPSPKDLKVGDVMTEGAYAVAPETPLLEALDEMDRNKYGCVVIQHSDRRVLGIFTAVDAVHALAMLLRREMT